MQPKTRIKTAVNSTRVMESETIQKNGVCPKTLKSRINELSMSILLMLGFISTINAQDIITTTTGNEIKAIVMEIGTTDVKYKKYENRNGPTYILRKSEIFMIKYQNGTKDVFTSNNRSAQNSNYQTSRQSGQSRYKEYSTQHQEYPSYRRKSPGGAFCLSFFLMPGAGQFYNGQPIKGAAMVLLELGSIGLIIGSLDNNYNHDGGATMLAAGIGIGFANWLWSSIDAPVSANAINRRNERNALSWEFGGNSTLSLSPDIYFAENKINLHKKEAVYGLSLKLNF